MFDVKCGYDPYSDQGFELLDPSLGFISYQEVSEGLQDGSYLVDETIFIDCIEEGIPTLEKTSWLPNIKEFGAGTYQQSRKEIKGEQCSYREKLVNSDTGEKFYADFIYFDGLPVYLDENELTSYRTVNVTLNVNTDPEKEGEWYPKILDQKKSFTQTRLAGDYNKVNEYRAYLDGDLIESWDVIPHDETGYEITREIHYAAIKSENQLFSNQVVDLANFEVSEMNSQNPFVLSVDHPIGSDEYNYAYSILPEAPAGMTLPDASMYIVVPDYKINGTEYYYTGKNISHLPDFKYQIEQTPSLILEQRETNFTDDIMLLANMTLRNDSSDGYTFTLVDIFNPETNQNVNFTNGNSLNKSFEELRYVILPFSMPN
jgi:hypothetical protein